jgi:hypothetical protein
MEPEVKKMLKNKTPQEQPTNPVEREKEATQWLAEQLKKAGWKSPQTFAVWKVVAQKCKCSPRLQSGVSEANSTQEAVFIFPAHSEGQIKRFLSFHGWDTIAVVQYADINAARKDSDDPTMLKTKGIVAKGSA